MTKWMSTITIAGLVAVALPACATKGFVRNRVGEVNGKVDNLSTSVEETQERTKKNEAAIGQVDQKAQAANAAAGHFEDDFGRLVVGETLDHRGDRTKKGGFGSAHEFQLRDHRRKETIGEQNAEERADERGTDLVTDFSDRPVDGTHDEQSGHSGQSTFDLSEYARDDGRVRTPQAGQRAEFLLIRWTGQVEQRVAHAIRRKSSVIFERRNQPMPPQI
jgi:hypothetical protein